MSASRRRSSKEYAVANAALLNDPKTTAEQDEETGKLDISTVAKPTAEVLPDLPSRARSKSRELSKKQGGGKKGLWGKPEDLIVLPKDEKHDPNYDSEEESDDVILVTSSPKARRLSTTAKAALFEGNARAFGISPVPDEVKAQIENIIAEYFSSGDADEVRVRLDELSVDTDGQFNYELVKRAITMSMDKHEREREAVSRLLSELYLNGLTPVELAQGFRRVIVSADDLALDIPTAVHMLSIFAARAIVDEILPPRFLEDPVLASHGEDVVQEAVKKLSINHGTVRMEKGWGPGDGRPVEELKVAIDQLTKEYLLSGDLEEASACVRELNVPHFHHEVVKRGIINSFEEGKEYTNAIGSLLAYLVSQDIVSTAQLRKGVDKVALALPDIQLDVPGAKGLLSALVTRAKSDGILPPDYHLQ
ncbi:hypothetical protein H310_00915 [Aphanomyces invadans]|uniref:MI domain-containing protein n=1 Tax=Aphanomyces invadans TaxID=157072 RepID=A0A024UPC0_9STRA|nr:hypothetical protein H310_00915 [Aphanomyces invadans]ETW08296.1 hypothetical protein H310_00915 [Aphanomyces invadans]RHY32082.1 hypothetical protein DYB32_002885 [Aphanomyces invadans]|eukprot:XP_008862101.1 hypothetical protein H310_00915 [Aphanomyces invadans]